MNKKFIAPVISGIFVLGYFLLLFLLFIFDANVIEESRAFFVILTIAFVCACGVIFYVVRQRINEIKGGEEDDLSKY